MKEILKQALAWERFSRKIEHQQYVPLLRLTYPNIILEFMLLKRKILQFGISAKAPEKLSIM